MEKLTEQPGAWGHPKINRKHGETTRGGSITKPRGQSHQTGWEHGQDCPHGSVDYEEKGSWIYEGHAPLPEKRHYPRLSAKERNTLTSPLLPYSSASHWISLPSGQLAKEPGKCHSWDAEQSREGWEIELRASRKTLPYSSWNSWTLHHFWAFLFTFSQAQDFCLVNSFFF